MCTKGPVAGRPTTCHPGAGGAPAHREAMELLLLPTLVPFPYAPFSCGGAHTTVLSAWGRQLGV